MTAWAVRKLWSGFTVTLPSGRLSTVAFCRFSTQLARRVISSPARAVLGLASTKGFCAGEVPGLGAAGADAGAAPDNRRAALSARAAMAAGTDVRMGGPLRASGCERERVWVIFALRRRFCEDLHRRTHRRSDPRVRRVPRSATVMDVRIS